MKGLVVAAALAVGAPVGLAAVVGAGPPGAGSAGTPSQLAISEIPAELLPVYRAAAMTCTGLPWQVLAGIGWSESRHAGGRADPATGSVVPPIVGPPIDGRPGFARIPDSTQPDGWAHALVISGWGQALWHVSRGAWRPRAIALSEGCEARRSGRACHTLCLGSRASWGTNIGRGAPSRRMTGPSRGWSSMTTSPSTVGGVPS